MGHVGTAHQPRGDGVDGVAPAVAGEVGAGDLEHPGAVVLPVEGLDVLRPVAGDVLGALEVLGDHLAGPQRRVVGEHQQQQHAHAGQDPAVGERRAEHLRAVRVAGRSAPTAEPSSTARPSTTSGTARGMLRMAPPACDVCSSRRKIAPSTDGLPHGCAPTARIAPTTTSATKKARSRNRPRPLPSNPRAGSSSDVPISHRCWCRAHRSGRSCRTCRCRRRTSSRGRAAPRWPTTVLATVLAVSV